MSNVQRTLKEVIDLDTMKVITSDDLISLCDDEMGRYDQIRHEATSRHQKNEPRYVCARCGHPVYAPLEPIRRLPYWQHFKGAPRDCEWWTGSSDSVDDISAKQFQGAQESPLHHKLKLHIEEILKMDSQVSEVRVEEYIIEDSKEKRKPDVFAVWKDKRLAFEVQLATTQIPIILAREDFYQRNNIFLIWVVWDFLESPLTQMNQSIRDVYRRHRNNLFSIDRETMELSKERESLFFRVFAHGYNGWKSELLNLDNLTWFNSASPYGLSLPQSWNQDFRMRWLNETSSSGMSYETSLAFFDELRRELGLKGRYFDFVDLEIPNLINVILSLEKGRPIGSSQNNLFELSNTFLSAKDRYQYADVFLFFVRRFNRNEILERDSVKKKIQVAKSEVQIRKGTMASMVLRALFEDWICMR